MNFRSLADLVEITRTHVAALPGDIDIVVGVPRSGMLPATVIALLLNKPLLDFESFLRGNMPIGGMTRSVDRRFDSIADIRRVLIVDDSVSSGRSMKDVRARIAKRRPAVRATLLAVIAGRKGAELVDIHFDLCPEPRVFEWNLMNSSVCESACFDLDGIFCRDPDENENDDGDAYRRFIRDVVPQNLPHRRLRRIVTSRLSAFRPETEAWLARHNIEYDALDMLDGATAHERRKNRLHTPFKAKIYAADYGARLFVESDPGQSIEIARLSGKPVLDFANMRIVGPETLSAAVVGQHTRRIVHAPADLTRRMIRKLRRSGILGS